jgi:hypothetical protein
MLNLCDTMFNMKQSVGFRLTEEALHLLDAMAAANGISRTAVLELAIRDAAKKQGIHADSGIQTQNQQKPTSRD